MSNSSNPTIIVPARLASVRFPRKLVANADGKPLIIRTAERISSEVPEYDLFFAVDGKELKELLETNGFDAILTPSDLPSGTDRIATANKKLNRTKIINVQADEPLVTRDQILSLSKLICEGDNCISTLACAFETEEDYKDPNQVKVVIDKNCNALYFSRSPIPFYREDNLSWSKKTNVSTPLKHIGMYGYDKKFLNYFLNSKEGELENVEKLEQLRALQNGYKIAVKVVESHSVGIDIPADLEKVKFV